VVQYPTTRKEFVCCGGKDCGGTPSILQSTVAGGVSREIDRLNEGNTIFKVPCPGDIAILERTAAPIRSGDKGVVISGSRENLSPKKTFPALED